MPWNQLTEAETKSVAKALETLQQQDFSSKSLKHWTALFNDKFDRSFITSRVGKLALVYNSCSLSLKQRFISLDVGKQAQQDAYTYPTCYSSSRRLFTAPSHATRRCSRFIKASSRLMEKQFKPTCRGRGTWARMPGALALDGPCPRHPFFSRRSVVVFCRANWPS